MVSATTDRRLGLAGNTAFKPPVDCATTASITLSGEQVIDGVTTSGSRVLVKDQVSAADNGIYDSSSAAWTRAIDANGNYDLKSGTLVLVAAGTVNAGRVYECTAANPITPGTTSITWAVSLTASISTLSFLQAGTGAVARDAQSKMREVVSAEDFGAIGDGVTDDYAAISAAISAAIASGVKRVVLTAGKNYLVSQTLYVSASGLVIDGYGATLTSASVNASGLRIGWNGSAFSKTDNVTVRGLTFVGADTGAGSTYSYAIAVEPPSTNPYVKGGGCSNIRIVDCNASGHAIGFVATAADKFKVIGGTLGGMEYHSALTAGGYGVLLQTCFSAGVYATQFDGQAGDRHAVYVSADPSRTFNNDNVCKGVTLTGLRIDWAGVTGITGFEAAIVLRAPEDAAVTGCSITGGYGCIDYEGENGNGKNISITGNVLDLPTSGGSERACVTFTRTSGSYICTGASISGNTMVASGSNLLNVSLNYVDNVTVHSNTLSQTGGVAPIKFGGTVTNAYVGGGSIYASSPNSVYYFSGSGNANITIARSQLNLSGASLYNFVTTPTGLTHDYTRVGVIRANSTGTPVVVSNPDEAIASVATDANGIAVTFTDQVSDVTYSNVFFGTANSSIVNAYYRSSSGQQVVIGVLSAAATAVPAASNNYDIVVFLKS